MAGANFPRIKNWTTTEDVTSADLNAEFDNILNNLTAANVDDFSTSVSQMQSTTDPGEVGTESKATSVAGEIQRLRFMIGEITGEDEWYESPIASLTGLANAIGSGLTNNRLVSGRVLTTSAQPAFLVPNGAARTVKLDGTPTSFIYYVDGTEYSISTDVTLTSLTAAPSSNNTCLIDDSVASAQYWTKYAGEDGSDIPVDTMGSELTALTGKFAAFKLAGAATEYFIAYIASTTRLSKARRGFFFDSADAPVPRTTYTNNDTITLMKATWIFAKTDGTLTATYTNPVWSDDEPSSPAIGDYWFDLSANTWKVYGVGSFATASAVLVGVCIQDTTNTVAARSFEFFKNYDNINTIEIVAESNTQVKSRALGAQISSWGTMVKNDYNLHTWDITLDLESGVTEGASTFYYFYITETGDKIISNKKPHDRRQDLYGYYHPSNSWRCVGRAFNNGSSNLEQVVSYFTAQPSEPIRSVIATDFVLTRDRVIVLSGATFTQYLPPASLTKGQIFKFVHGGTSLTQVYTLDGFGAETIGGFTTYGLYTANETLEIMSDGSNYLVMSHRAQTAWLDSGVITITATTSAPTKGSVQSFDKFWWRRDQDKLLGRYEFRQTNATSSAAGTGDYLFLAVPASTTIDTTVLTAYTTVEGSGQFYISNNFGIGHLSDATNTIAPHVVVFDTTTVRLIGTGDDTEGAIGSGFYPVTSTNYSLTANFVLPITGWKS